MNAIDHGPLREQLSAHVRDGLHDAGMTQRDLAVKAGITQKHVSRMLRHHEGTVEMWERLLLAVNR